MRIAGIADAHGNSIGLRAVLADVDEQGIDHILVMGDLVGYYPYVNEVLALARSRGMVCVSGNHEAYLLGRLPVPAANSSVYNLGYVADVIEDGNRDWLASLPTQRCLEFGDSRWHMCHGSPWAVDEYVYPDYAEFQRFCTLGTDVVLMGHTHIPMVRRVGQTLLVNPGSCGQPRDGDLRASYAIIDTGDLGTAQIRRVAYDAQTVCERTSALGFDQRLVEILGCAH